MKVLAVTTLSERNDDCYIAKSISLVEVLETYTVITAEKTVGFDNDMRIYANPNSTCDLMEALHIYKQDGGYIPDELKV